MFVYVLTRYYHRLDKKVGQNVQLLLLLHAVIMSELAQELLNPQALNGQCILYNFV